MIVRELVTEWGISVDMAKLIAFDRKLEDVKRTVNGLGDSIKRIGERVSSVGTKLTLGLTVPIIGLGYISTRNAALMQSWQFALERMMGSAELAKAEIERLQQSAKAPGLGLEEAVRGSVSLQGAGFSAEFARKAMEEFSNEVAATGGNRENMKYVIKALTDIQAKGKLAGQEVIQLQNALPSIRILLKEAFGTSSQEQLAEMGITSETLLTKLVAVLEKKARVKGGLQNSIDNLGDSWFRLTVALGKLEGTHVQSVLEAIGGAMDFIAKKIEGLPQWAKDFLALGLIATAALGPLVFILGKIVSMIGSFLFFKAVIYGMSGGFGALAASVGAVLLPFVAWGAAIAGVGLLLYMLYENAGDIFRGIIGWVGDVADSIGNGIANAVQTAIDWLKKLPDEVITSAKGFFGVEQGAGNAQSGAFGGLGPFAPIPPSVANSNATTNSTAINAPITVNVPEGTTVEQADNIARIASKTVTAHLDTMLRNAQGAYR